MFHKYHAKKTQVAGQVFDSMKEANRFCELRILERAGEISNLRTQVPFLLIPAQRDSNGKLIEKSVTYKADFVYDKDGQTIVEDTKGCKTGTAYQVFSIKRKLMLKVHGIRVQEV